MIKVRERGEYKLEEDLFAKLLFIYRSPETIIYLTRPPILQGKSIQNSI